MSRNQTESELSFEQYLGVNGFAFRREPHDSEQERRPDYVISRQGYEVACEVKEFQERDIISGQILWTDGGDRSVKRKLHKAYGQFHAFNHLPCCVVLATNDPLVELADPDVMLGAMYGRVAVEVRCDPVSGEVISTERVFDRGGRMLDTHTGSTRNTAISALITLQRFRLGMMRLRKLLRQYMKLTQRPIRTLTKMNTRWVSPYGKTCMHGSRYQMISSAETTTRDTV